jgi:hypothetical protein
MKGMAELSAEIRLRPTRIGFLTPPTDLASVRVIMRVCTCLWAVRFQQQISRSDCSSRNGDLLANRDIQSPIRGLWATRAVCEATCTGPSLRGVLA